MDRRSRWSRVLVLVGLILMILGLIDPLEGSIVILAGGVLLAVGALLAPTRHRKFILWSVALLAIGIGVLWGISLAGGFKGPAGRAKFWMMLSLLPYAVGEVLSIIAGIRRLREGWKKPEETEGPVSAG